MLIKTLTVGQLETNCYIVTDENTLECAVIDPGAESETILDYIEEHKLTVRAIFITHSHFDHVIALPAVAEETRAPVYAHRIEIDETRRGGNKLQGIASLRQYKEGDTITVGSLVFRVLETPGHTMGGVTLQCENALFTGDTLFRGSMGRTDLGGSDEVILRSLRRLSQLSEEYEVYPGHGDTSTIGYENKFNYYVKFANSGAPLSEMSDED